MTRAVALWLAQSLLGAVMVLVWFAATWRAKQLGAKPLVRWLFPWAPLWMCRRFALPVAQIVLVAAYALCMWLARSV